MAINSKLDYVELPSKDINATKEFFTSVFGWGFDDYGTDYAAFSNQGMDGGFYKSDTTCTSDDGSVLLIFYFEELSTAQKLIEANGGCIVKPIFSFPGGSRFHFMEPGGNELAVWSKKDV